MITTDILLAISFFIFAMSVAARTILEIVIYRESKKHD